MRNRWFFFVGIICCLIVPTAFLTGQEITVPKAIISSYHKMYPSTAEEIWEKEEHTYLVTFNEGDLTKIATYNRNGDWQQTVTGLDLEYLPLVTQNYLTCDYGLMEYNRIRKVEIPNFVKYFVKLEIEDKTIILTFDEKGNLLEKEIEPL